MRSRNLSNVVKGPQTLGGSPVSSPGHPPNGPRYLGAGQLGPAKLDISEGYPPASLPCLSPGSVPAAGVLPCPQAVKKLTQELDN